MTSLKNGGEEREKIADNEVLKKTLFAAENRRKKRMPCGGKKASGSFGRGSFLKIKLRG